MNSDSPQSPCIAVCALDENDICLGCFRTGDEITDWFMASDLRKREIIAAGELRRSQKYTVELK